MPSRRSPRPFCPRRARPTPSSGKPSSAFKKRYVAPQLGYLGGQRADRRHGCDFAPARRELDGEPPDPVTWGEGLPSRSVLLTAGGSWRGIIDRSARQGVRLPSCCFSASRWPLGAYPLVRRLTGRVERLQRQAEALGAGELGARVDVDGNDEVAWARSKRQSSRGAYRASR